jgi:hypothetical protein
MGMCLLSFFAIEPDTAQHSNVVLHNLQILAYTLFRTRTNLQIVMYGAHITHVYEASLSFEICKKVLKSSNKCTYMWCVQTFIFGYGSLYQLHEREKFIESLKK